jgi:hypothetical protein
MDMGQESPADHISKRFIVYRVPGMEAVTVRRDVAFKVIEAVPLTMDLYRPPDAKQGTRIPVVILALGYSDLGAAEKIGGKFKDMGAYTSWARLIAASGLAAVAYSTREPAADLAILLEFLRANAESLGIDTGRMGLWACSGNGPMALAGLMGDAGGSFKCAVLTHAYMLDLDGSTAVAEAARMFGFVNPAAGKPADNLLPELPLFIVRAGGDELPRLNESIDRFLAMALARNLPVTFVNHPAAPHAYDLFHDSEESRQVIRQILTFLRFHLLGPPGSS